MPPAPVEYQRESQEKCGRLAMSCTVQHVGDGAPERPGKGDLAVVGIADRVGERIGFSCAVLSRIRVLGDGLRENFRESRCLRHLRRPLRLRLNPREILFAIGRVEGLDTLDERWLSRK